MKTESDGREGGGGRKEGKAEVGEDEGGGGGGGWRVVERGGGGVGLGVTWGGGELAVRGIICVVEKARLGMYIACASLLTRAY